VIVIGSRGLSGLKEMFKGSLSHQVAEHAGRPVLICRHPSPRAPTTRRPEGARMTKERTHTIGSLIATATKAFALVSLVRTIGPRRIGRLATLAAEGYFLGSRRGHRHG
jgi:Universal stress protein family